jgi:hypothetical protein
MHIDRLIILNGSLRNSVLECVVNASGSGYLEKQAFVNVIVNIESL